MKLISRPFELFYCRIHCQSILYSHFYWILWPPFTKYDNYVCTWADKNIIDANRKVFVIMLSRWHVGRNGGNRSKKNNWLLFYRIECEQPSTLPVCDGPTKVNYWNFKSLGTLRELHLGDVTPLLYLLGFPVAHVSRFSFWA